MSARQYVIFFFRELSCNNQMVSFACLMDFLFLTHGYPKPVHGCFARVRLLPCSCLRDSMFRSHRSCFVPVPCLPCSSYNTPFLFHGCCVLGPWIPCTGHMDPVSLSHGCLAPAPCVLYPCYLDPYSSYLDPVYLFYNCHVPVPSVPYTCPWMPGSCPLDATSCPTDQVYLLQQDGNKS